MRGNMTDNSTNAGFDLIIEPNRTTVAFFRELLRYRELFYFLAWRDILVRYKQTVIGIAWSVIRPLLTMLVFTFTLSKGDLVICGEPQ